MALSCLAGHGERSFLVVCIKGSWGLYVETWQLQVRNYNEGGLIFYTSVGMWWFSLTCYLITFECLCEEWTQTDLGVKISIGKFIGPLKECKLITEHRLRAGPLKEALQKKNLAWPKLDKWRNILEEHWTFFFNLYYVSLHYYWNLFPQESYFTEVCLL